MKNAKWTPAFVTGLSMWVIAWPAGFIDTSLCAALFMTAYIALFWDIWQKALR